MPETVSDYAKTHCAQCKYGWSRDMADGGEFMICLLDRQQVYKTMTRCNRYKRDPDAPTI